MKTRRRKNKIIAVSAILCVIVFASALFFGIRGISYRRPYRSSVERYSDDSSLIYAVMKAESNFRESAKSAAGAIGIMQILPSTAEFVCRLHHIPFEEERLTEGSYNCMIGCLYIKYLTEKFQERETVLAAYNAGEGTISEWLKNRELSIDGKTLIKIPYIETSEYVKKVVKFRKNYLFFYH